MIVSDIFPGYLQKIICFQYQLIKNRNIVVLYKHFSFYKIHVFPKSYDWRKLISITFANFKANKSIYDIK